ncbi:hypothetical protein [Cytobacillus oceanisediminis]|uniref:hypothetical protein n=1 Tax=Cytobacillus oceanisediminis TaxID=665099 RepID=UPI00204164CF|nr:hypothetical protein [Cytobacillus oceanisediminis]MCM3405469.1 hypothetical protein [Cytobacillus oceanisediminis]
MSRLMHLYTACPRCRSGIMTPYAVIRKQEDGINMILIDEFYKYNENEFISTICSLEECGYTEQIATPGTLYNKKTNIRQKLESILVEK